MNGVQRIITEKTFLNAIWIFTGMKHPNTEWISQNSRILGSLVPLVLPAICIIVIQKIDMACETGCDFYELQGWDDGNPDSFPHTLLSRRWEKQRYAL